MKKILLLLAAAVLLHGCFSMNPRRLRAVEQHFLADYPEMRIDSRLAFSLGALTLDMVDFLFLDEPQFDLSKISRADIAVYEVSNMPALRGISISPKIFERAGCPAWETVIRVREDDELFSLFACVERERLRGFAFVTLAPDEIVVVNARGDFAAILQSLLKSTLHEEESVLAVR